MRPAGATDMSAFDAIPRGGSDPPHQNETAFAYLNRSGRPEAQRVRELVDAWLSRYPAAARETLIGRFRSPINDEHLSAYFELFLHELLLARGHSVLAVEPGLTHTAKSPDFLAETPEGQRFYLEATLATGRSRQEASAQKRLNDLLSVIDATQSPQHFLDVQVHGVPSIQISGSRVRRRLRKWIAELPAGMEARDAAPFVFEESGVRLRLTPWPRQTPAPEGRAIGVRHFSVQQIQPHEDIRNALLGKAQRYGSLEHPLIVAVNALRLF